jgi:hypothetical protein
MLQPLFIRGRVGVVQKMGLGILVDDRGETWTDSSMLLSKTLGTGRTGPDLIRYLVQSVGFIHIRYGQTGSIINYAHDAATQCALIGTLYWLMDNRPERVMLEPFPNSTSPRQLLPYAHALKHIAALCDARTTRPLFSRRPMIMDESPFAVRWEAAKEILASNDINDSVRLLILDKLLQSYFTVSRKDRDTGRYIVQHVGNGITHHVLRGVESNRPALGAIESGKPFSEIADPDYGRWLDSTFMAISDDTEPFAEYVEATLGATTANAKMIRYSRLVLPFVRASDTYLLTASDIRS